MSDTDVAKPKSLEERVRDRLHVPSDGYSVSSGPYVTEASRKKETVED